MLLLDRDGDWFSERGPTLSANIGSRELVDLAKLRWPIERDYLELRQQVALGDFEGRGFHHHDDALVVAVTPQHTDDENYDAVRLGDKAASMIVSEVSYEVTDPTVDSQTVRLKASRADLFYNITSPNTRSIDKKGSGTGMEARPDPGHQLDLRWSGPQVSRDRRLNWDLSVNYTKDPLDLQWSSDPCMKR
ncbi:hypothetical protein AB8A28_00380 [Tardiphaga sp. 71_E8_N1_1]|uniref:hypothetical protein n=1 Tax=Tardiphaga sp. 71_E8_N1_1 TaxID=3240784 RepID=UPI003F8982EF